MKGREIMDKEDTIDNLAIGMAQAYLLEYRKEHPENIGYLEETRFYIKSYLQAFRKISEEYDDVEID